MSDLGEPRESSPVVLVAGATRVGKSTLIKGITGSEATEAGSTWSVETKYYTATLDVHESDDSCASTSGQPEALVLVFSLGSPSTLGIAQSIAGRFDLEAIEVKVLCGTHADALLPGGEAADLDTAAQPPWFQEALDWSIENGFEFVACCPALPSADAGLALDGDKQGVARVVEVLHAHTWPNLVLLPREERQRPQGAAATAGDHDRQDGAAALDSAQGPTPAAGAVAEGDAAAAAAAQPPRQGPEQPPQGPASRPSPSSGQGPQQAAAEPEEAESAEADRMLDGLERLMEEMRGHKARISGLPDTERREQAAAMALRMLQMLGLDESGSGSDEDV